MVNFYAFPVTIFDTVTANRYLREKTLAFKFFSQNGTLIKRAGARKPPGSAPGN